MIGRRLLALAGALALAGCGASEDDWPAPSPALWEVSDDSGRPRGWLFGTIHALPDGAEWRTPAVDAALGEADVLVVEIAALGDRAAAATFAAVSTSPGLPPLLQRVSAADRPALAGALDRAGLDEAELARTESWAAALLIASGARESEAENGVDRALLARGLPVVALESHIAQFAMFDRLRPADQAVLLAEAARHAGTPTERRLTEAWLTGDVAVVAREMQDGILADPELRQALLTTRNEAWARRVSALLAEDRQPFVAVGAAHMLGEEGLPARLAHEGYLVKRVQ